MYKNKLIIMIYYDLLYICYAIPSISLYKAAMYMQSVLDFEYTNITIVSAYSLTCLLCASSNGDLPNCIINTISNV